MVIKSIEVCISTTLLFYFNMLQIIRNLLINLHQFSRTAKLSVLNYIKTVLAIFIKIEMHFLKIERDFDELKITED